MALLHIARLEIIAIDTELTEVFGIKSASFAV